MLLIYISCEQLVHVFVTPYMHILFTMIPATVETHGKYKIAFSGILVFLLLSSLFPLLYLYWQSLMRL